LFEWQFAVRGPPGTDFEGGIYTGRIVLPVNYPLAPPSIMLLTPNGRWEVGKKICLSNTSYHPDLWQPAWGIRTMMEALRSHFPMPGDGAIGAIDWPSELRQQLAKDSLDFVCQPGGKRNRELLPELSPEELKEDLPEPAPFLPAGAAAEPAAAAAEGEAAGSGSPPTDTTTAPAATDQGPDDAGLPQGLRCRCTSEAGPVPAVPSSPAAASSSSAGPSAPPRRRREGARQQRRQQPMLVQLLKPPTTGRGWVLFLIDVLIALLSFSFLLVLLDIVRSPPKLLDALPEYKGLSD